MNTPSLSPAPEASLDTIRGHLRQELGPERYGRYFDQASVALRYEQGQLVVTVASGFEAQFLSRNFGPSLERSLPPAPTLDRERVRFQIDAAAAPRGVAPAAGERVIAHRAPAARLERRHTLEDFVVGEPNRLAHAAAMRLIESPKEMPASLFVHGPCGQGKTHLLRAIARGWGEQRPGSLARYTTAEAFTNEFITSLRTGKAEAFRRTYRRVELLCIDDVHFLGGKEATQTELLHTLDAIGMDRARIVLASDEHPRRIETLSKALVSRFLSGLVVEMAPLDEALCGALVRHMAARRGLGIDEPAGELLAAHVLADSAASARHVEGIITRAHALLSLTGGGAKTIDAALARRVLGLDAQGQVFRPARPLAMEEIIACVCKALAVDAQELRGPNRHARLVLARAMAAHLARRLTTQSYPEIARALGRPNHSGVLTACRRLEAQIGAGGRVPQGVPALAGVSLEQARDRLAAQLAQVHT